MKFTDRIKSLLGVEGSHRGPFFGMGELGGWSQIDPLGDGWQRNLRIDANTTKNIPAVYACVMTISRAVSQCYPVHYSDKDDNPKRVTTSAAYRVSNRPNSYQSGTEFLLNLMATALFEGESFAVASRNDRSEIKELHLLPTGTCTPMVDNESGSIFYSIGSNPMDPKNADFIAPARDILHLKFHTPRHPLIGETPIKAAAMAAGISVALSRNQAAFFERMNRPSGVMTTDTVLNAQQMEQLRSAFENQSKSWQSGGMPILGGGLKFQPMSISSQDAQLIQAQRMAIEDIARVFGVPTPLIGDLSHATLNNTESLINHFLSISLGSYLEVLERSLDRLFGLPMTEYIQLDTTALLRTDFAGQIEGLTKGIQGGLMCPNEARLQRNLPPIAGGEAVFMQQQNVPISILPDLHAASLKEKLEPDPQPEPAQEPKPEEKIDPEIAKLFVVDFINKKRAA
jgi:HK97 family phage portal protein